MTDLPEILEDMRVFKKYYSHARLVDPLSKQVISCDGAGSIISYLEDGHDLCYQFFSTGHVCLNCISMRAALENESFVKFEYLNDKIFMVMALPIHLRERVIALELLKEVKHQDIVESLAGSLGEQEFLDIRYTIVKLNELVVKDSLTQIYNRRYIDEKLPVEIIKAKLANVPLSVIMADLDDFRKVNDQYGHVVGDEALKAFSREIGKNIRQGNDDWVSRYGGEEFFVCLGNCKKEDALLIAERMRKAVEEMEIPISSGTLKITSSFGVYTYYNQDMDVHQLIEAVDRNLYAAKNSGRNRVVVGE